MLFLRFMTGLDFSSSTSSTDYCCSSSGGGSHDLTSYGSSLWSLSPIELNNDPPYSLWCRRLGYLTLAFSLTLVSNLKSVSMEYIFLNSLWGRLIARSSRRLNWSCVSCDFCSLLMSDNSSSSSRPMMISFLDWACWLSALSLHEDINNNITYHASFVCD